MNENYLWDRTGERDPDTARLEDILSRLQHRPATAKFETIKPKPKRGNSWMIGLLAAAAAVVTVSVAARDYLHRKNSPTIWTVSVAGGKAQSLHIGEEIKTGDHPAELDADFVGQVQVEPNSWLRVRAGTREQQRLALQQGTIHALIWAPPTRFVVDTPSSSTIDLGCRYTLHVAPDGSGLLNVELGWVAFEWHDIESFIPAGASCTTKPSQGPGIPYFEDASGDLRKAIAQFESGKPEGLSGILASARPRDALTLWHLLSRTHGEQRNEVFQRLVELVDVPREVTKERILKGDPQAFDAAWNALNLGDTNWWREWKRRW